MLIENSEQAKQWEEYIKLCNQAEAESKSTLKLHQLVRCCQSPGMFLNSNNQWEDYPHDHNNSEECFDSRVVGWDSYGRITVSTKISNNPHCSSCCWYEANVLPRGGYDWFTDREDDRVWQKIDSKIFFMWEQPGWNLSDGYPVGATVKAVLKHPHINYGDWIVEYEKPSGSWITRVVNEMQMWIRND